MRIICTRIIYTPYEMEHRIQEISQALNLRDLTNTVIKYDYYFHGTPYPQELTIKGITFAAIVLPDNSIAFGSDNDIYFYDIKEQRISVVLQGHKGVIDRLKLLSNGDLVSQSRDMRVRVWNLITFNPYAKFKSTARINDIEILSDDRIVIAPEGQYMIIWDPSDNSTVHFDQQANHVTLINDHKMDSSFMYNELYIWNIDIEKLETIKRASSDTIMTLIVVKDKIVCAMEYGNIAIYENDGTYIGTIGDITNDPVEYLYAITDNIIASGSFDGVLKIWNLKTLTNTQTFDLGFNEDEPNTITCIITLPDGNIVIGTPNPILYVYNPYTGELLYGLNDAFNNTALFFINNKVVNVMENGKVTIWE